MLPAEFPHPLLMVDFERLADPGPFPLPVDFDAPPKRDKPLEKPKPADAKKLEELAFRVAEIEEESRGHVEGPKGGLSVAHIEELRVSGVTRQHVREIATELFGAARHRGTGMTNVEALMSDLHRYGPFADDP